MNPHDKTSQFLSVSHGLFAMSSSPVRRRGCWGWFDSSVLVDAKASVTQGGFRKPHFLQPTFQMTWAISRAVLTVSMTRPKMPAPAAASPSS